MVFAPCVRIGAKPATIGLAEPKQVLSDSRLRLFCRLSALGRR